MIKKEITLYGKTYPVAFSLDTLVGFEDMTEKSFFDCKFNTLRDRIAIVYASVATADENTKLTINEVKGNGDVNSVNEIIKAFSVVSEMSAEFFKIPKIVADTESEEHRDKDKSEDNAKN